HENIVSRFGNPQVGLAAELAADERRILGGEQDALSGREGDQGAVASWAQIDFTPVRSPAGASRRGGLDRPSAALCPRCGPSRNPAAPAMPSPTPDRRRRRAVPTSR